MTYTFDDALPSQMTHWPDLAGTGVRMTFYLNTWRRPLSPSFDSVWSDVLKRGSELGNHTVTHCYFAQRCAEHAGSVHDEIDGVTDYVTALGGAVRTMAYPYGDGRYEPSARERFFLSRGVRAGSVLPDADLNPFDLPVVAARGGESESTLDRAVERALADGAWIIFVFHTLLPKAGKQVNGTGKGTAEGSNEDAYAPVDASAVVGSMARSSTMKDVWVHTLETVGAYWLGAKVVTAALARRRPGHAAAWTLPVHFPSGRSVRIACEARTLRQAGRALQAARDGSCEVALDLGELDE